MTGDRLDRLAAHLRATGERPVERSAARWLGEAEAIATDLAESDLESDARAKRLDQLDHLLSNVETTGDEDADDHLESARDLLTSLRET
ncbi:hypothetical protein ACFQJ5_07225 [Halomicroarcula sp. GCM10025324]|uniref:hypothetical protein n=1 Tax=Haloarcula TaxID=2237 RepID=UPI0023E777FB|nr:hypothetical protein [Halomicroarcula sp. ZS-22-S1]